MSKRRTYYCPKDFSHTDGKTSKTVTAPAGYPSDGASGAIDIYSYGWFVHDVLCDRGTWDDGAKCKPKDASRVLRDILRSEGRRFRAFYWYWATLAHTKRTGLGKRGMRKALPERAGDVEYQ